MKYYLIKLATIMVLSIPLSAWDDITSYSFTINPTSSTYLKEDVSTSLGSADVLFYVTNCSMQGSGSGIVIDGPAQGSGSCGIQYSFDTPVDLTPSDFIKIVQTHSSNKNRLSGIYLTRANSARLELKNLSLSPFLDNQTNYALYDFESAFDVWVYPPDEVIRIDLIYDILSSENIFIENLSLETIGPRESVSAECFLGGTRDLTISSDRTISTNEIIRLEASHNLINWFEKSNFTAGAGSTTSYEKVFEDAQFYRLRVHLSVSPTD